MASPYTVTQPLILPEMLGAATKRDVPFTRRGMARVHETQFATSYLTKDWSSERWAVMWDETGATGLTMKAPTGYGWCPGCGLGPHKDVVQHEGTLVGIFNIPTTWTWQYTNDSIRTNTTAVINDATTTGRLFLQYSKVLLAITRSDIGHFTWPPASQTSCLKRGYVSRARRLAPQSYCRMARP